MKLIATWLPWTAAIAFGALVGAWVFSAFLSDVRTAYPYALGLSAVVGVPMAMRYRGDRDWGRAGIMVAIGVVLVVLARSCSSGGGVAGVILAVLQVSLFVAMAARLSFFGLPTATLILSLSGEWRAMAQGTSVANLPYGGLRVAVLLVLTVAPLALYASGPTRGCGDGPGGVRGACDRPAAAANGFNH